MVVLFLSIKGVMFVEESTWDGMEWGNEYWVHDLLLC